MDFPVPVNDNYIAQSLYEGNGDHLPYVPAARYLIGKYTTKYWKYDCNDPDFIFMEYMLCNRLSIEATCGISKQFKAKCIAGVLDISPLHLYNDPKLTL